MNLSVDPGLCEIFADTAKHKAIREIIYRHSTNKLDVRGYALEGLNLESANEILDLGCGFGFFTLSLKNKVPLNAAVIGIDRISQNRASFLDACRSIGIKGKFNGSGIDSIKTLPSNRFELILCSYALYFFPEIMFQIGALVLTGFIVDDPSHSF